MVRDISSLKETIVAILVLGTLGILVLGTWVLDIWHLSTRRMGV